MKFTTDEKWGDKFSYAMRVERERGREEERQGLLKKLKILGFYKEKKENVGF